MGLLLTFCNNVTQFQAVLMHGVLAGAYQMPGTVLDTRDLGPHKAKSPLKLTGLHCESKMTRADFFLIC